jgi:hypothetical protein
MFLKDLHGKRMQDNVQKGPSTGIWILSYKMDWNGRKITFTEAQLSLAILTGSVQNPVLGPTQPSIQWVTRASFPGGKGTGA